MPVPDGFIEVGKIVAAQGIRGEVRVYPSSDFPERFMVKGERWLQRPNSQTAESIKLLKGYYQEGKGLYIVKLEGVQDRNQAEKLRNALLLVREDDKPELDEGEFHISDLIGLPVYQQADQALVGTVTNLFHAGHDLLEVAVEGRDNPVLIPFVEAMVPVVDLDEQRIEITPPPGLLDL
ncbi:ribosome maturation factor RimM [filamentous cyanobacterium LEGE 11480]|uniref:Ribosome maturation factor RimM n=1 Tax=Romeriopsis navalis LEGE 11480 TaxID=2777977 RepID=A0A928Z1E6_9CYAN|nr:ribosome maturation factor RimM [Romeriopsis navalis]MBE9028429.1 ribosome maturation factor RimM [Romeriopsis navalis LEGE 11480]